MLLIILSVLVVGIALGYIVPKLSLGEVKESIKKLVDKVIVNVLHLKYELGSLVRKLVAKLKGLRR